MLPESQGGLAGRRKRCSVGVFWIAEKQTWRVRWRDPATRKMTTKHFGKQERARALAWAAGRKWEERHWGEDAVSTAERLLLERLREAAARGGWTLQEVMPQLLEVVARHRREVVPPGEALERFLAEGRARNLRAATLASYEEVCRDVIERGEVRALGQMDAGWLKSFILRRHEGEASRKKAARHVLAWLRWCSGKGWCAMPGPVTWPAARSDAREIASLSAGEARALLGALPAELRAGAALGLFAGLRPEEALRITWEAIRLRERVIQVSGAVAKIREARTLDRLPETVWAWLEAHPGERTGRVIPVSKRAWQGRMRAAKAAAGVKDRGNDLLRKTFASMAFHLPGGPQHAAEIMGHLRGLQVYLRHYRAVRTPEECREFFGIRPRAD